MPSSWRSVVVETRSISGLSPYNSRRTAERRTSCEPRLQFIGYHDQARPGSAARTNVHFFQKRRSPPVAFVFVPALESFGLVLFFLSGSQFCFFYYALHLDNLSSVQVFAPRAFR